MRYLVEGRWRADCHLRPAEYLTLAVREWELVLSWLAAGRLRSYGRLGGVRGALVLEAASEAEAWRLARALPFAPYVELWVQPLPPTPEPGGPRRAGDGEEQGGTSGTREAGPRWRRQW